MKRPILLPEPQELELRPGAFILTPATVISLAPADACEYFAGQQLQAAIQQYAAIDCPVLRAYRILGPGEIRFEHDAAIENREAYTLAISPDGVVLAAGAAAGFFRGVQTLRQLVRQYQQRLPAMQLADWPDFSRRAFYHDVSRGKVPRLETILTLVDDLAALKINEFQLYVENVFAFRRHPAMYDDTTPLTADELQRIDLECRRRHIDFVPSLTSLGHFEKILRRPAYRHLAEAEPEALTAAGVATWSSDPWTLCTSDPAAKQLLEQMYDEFLPNFTSKTFNICCDESWDLGKGRSSEEAARIGTGRMYTNWVRYCHALAAARGRQVQLWGDIILNHRDLIPEIPQDATLLEWGYEAQHPFAEHGKLFAQAGRRFYVCPGTSSWLTIAGRTTNAIGNLQRAAEAGRQHGAAGYMITDWGDHGHQQMLAVSMLPMAYGAAVSWNGRGSKKNQFLEAASVHVFGDRTGTVARAIAQLGDLGLTLDGGKKKTFNASPEFFLFREPWDEHGRLDQVKQADVEKAARKLPVLRLRLIQEFDRPDGELLRDEFLFSANCVNHALCRTLERLHQKRTGRASSGVTALAAEVKALGREFRRLWLARNKPSRMDDVLAHFTRLENEYHLHGASRPGRKAVARKAAPKRKLSKKPKTR